MMPVSLEQIEHEPAGGTLYWMAYMFVATTKATIKGVLSVLIVSFPAIVVAAVVPAGPLLYTVFLLFVGISIGGVYKDFNIDIDWSRLESGFDCSVE
ncbi:hypothetical protein [Haloarcula marismortui]|uniref:Uncharacterized protein n=1 Tax=Haloarcula marismortui ATCC 33800 TaxID=662476 RepID=M0JN67_9EURY|nr:hypothetical protein [Haloarcula sinaiiensis]EMA09808.1 hypothetical protein C436_18656 [Haloarcula sinaiiensis ATCC 33800]QUJ74718.1 hypothetical protein KDQ40_20890 [Haloarcula sinaiiensis ATCC 33800]